MWKKLITTLGAAAMTLVIAGGATAKEENAKIKKASFSILVPYKSEINVTSSDGAKWDTIVPETFPLWANAVVDTRRTGYVERAGIFLGRCTGNSCGSHPRLYAGLIMERDMRSSIGDFTFDTSKIPDPKQGKITPISTSRDILNACNAGLQPNGATKSRTTRVQIQLSLSVNTRRAASLKRQLIEGTPPGVEISFGGGDVTRHASFIIQVNCKAFQKIQEPPQPFLVDVQVEQKGKTCPKKTDVRAIIKYRQPATARFRFKVDGKLSKVHEIKARHIKPNKPHSGPGKGGHYLVERLKTYHLDPGQTHFRVVMEDGSGKKSTVRTVKIKCPPFKINSMWLSYDVQDKGYCPKNVKEKLTMKATRPGKAPFRIKTQAGLVVHSGVARFKRKGMDYVAVERRDSLSMNAFDAEMMAEIKDEPGVNSGWVPLKVECLERLDAQLTVRDLTTSTKCPRKGSVKVGLKFNMFREKVRYRVDCTGNRSWTRDTISKKSRTGPDFGVTDYLNFTVKKTEQVNCALKDMYDGGKVIAVAGHKFNCVIPTQETPDEMTQDTRPDPQHPGGPRYPGKVVIDPPRPPVDPSGPADIANPGPICLGGTVKNGKCLCDRTRTPQQTGRNAWRCVLIATVGPTGPDKGGKRTDATPDYPKKTRADAEADKKRLEALKRKQALEARKKAEAAKKAAEARRKREAAKKAAVARRKREAAKKAAEARRKRETAKKAAEARRKREAAKKAAELRRKRAAAKKAAELRRRREAAKRAAAAKKAAEMRRKRKAAPPPSNRSRSRRRR